MPSTADPASPPVGSCRGCGYALRGLSSNRCPECGREFDPADRKTMNMGRRPGMIARRLARPLGWPVLAAMLLASAGIAYATRPQLGNWREWDPAPVDLPLYLDVKA